MERPCKSLLVSSECDVFCFQVYAPSDPKLQAQILNHRVAEPLMSPSLQAYLSCIENEVLNGS